MSTPATGTDAPVPSHGGPLPNTTQLYNGYRKLPELPIQLADLPERLDGYSNYDSWSYLIETTLESADIPQIIRPSIPRPSPSDPSYPLWRRTSLVVKNWLVRQINPHVLSRVLRTDTIHETLSPPIPDPPSNNPSTPTPTPPPPPEIIFADTIYTLIYQVVMNHLPGHQALHSETAYANCIFMTRVPPTQTPAAFIAAFRHAVHLTNRLWCTVTPYCAALLLLRRVRADFGDALVDGLVRGLDQLGAPRRYMFVEFDTLCDFLIRRAEGEVGGGGDSDGEVGVGVEAQGEGVVEVSGGRGGDGDREGDTVRNGGNEVEVEFKLMLVVGNKHGEQDGAQGGTENENAIEDTKAIADEIEQGDGQGKRKKRRRRRRARRGGGNEDQADE